MMMLFVVISLCFYHCWPFLSDLWPAGLGGIFGGMDTSDEEDEDYIPQKKKKKKKKSAAPKESKSVPAEVNVRSAKAQTVVL